MNKRLDLLQALRRTAFTGLLLVQVAGARAQDNAFFAARRDTLMKNIPASAAVLQGAPEMRAYVKFRQDNNFYYLTGVEVPNAILLLDTLRHRSVLFLPPRNAKQELWEGPHLFAGPEARIKTGVDAVMELSEFGGELEKLKADIKVWYTPFSPQETAATSREEALKYESARTNDLWDGRISREAAFRNSLQAKLGQSIEIQDLSPVMDEMRRVKDRLEVERLREAGRIGSLALKEAMRSVKSGVYEYQLAAVAEQVIRWHGAMGSAFFPIVGSGPNSCILHYSENMRKMENGDIVVMDFGPDYGYYVSDITRSFPVSGKFSREQARVYQVVLDAQKAALEKIRPGATFDMLNDAARKVLERFGYAAYLNHSVSHYIGMSAHDVGGWVPFEPGVVITVEPGVYMPDQNLGIRIEDSVLVTENGYEILSKGVPKEIGEIEKLMSEPSAVRLGGK